jgi:cytochrome c peroxidase
VSPRRTTAAVVAVAAAFASLLAHSSGLGSPGVRPAPADNPMTSDKVALGRRLFYDADLSVDGTMSCATCHEQHRAFTEGNPTHPGVNGEPGRRNVPGLANVGDFRVLTWADPSLTSLEKQVLVPLTGDHPVEMGMGGKERMLTARLAADPCYRRMFADAFSGKASITVTKIAQAIASFERTFTSSNAPYDRYRRGETAALSDPARRGAGLFFGPRFQCASCHAGPNFTDGRFHNIGLGPTVGTDPDEGLSEKTKLPEDAGRFRTPSLRNVALTAPYFHDGREAHLTDAILDHYPKTNSSGRGAPRRHRPSATELTELIARLDSLTDQQFVTDPSLSLPKSGCNFST